MLKRKTDTFSDDEYTPTCSDDEPLSDDDTVASEGFPESLEVLLEELSELKDELKGLLQVLKQSKLPLVMPQPQDNSLQVPTPFS